MGLATPPHVRLASRHVLTLDALRVALAPGLGLSLTACGGHTAALGTDRDAGSNAVGEVKEGASNAICPAEPPTTGGACSPSGAWCGYATANNACGSANCYCQGAAWDCEPTCTGGVEGPGFGAGDAATHDATDAAGDAARDATETIDSAYDGGPVACGTMTCETGAVCVFDQQEGGALRRPDDAGNCPDGQVLMGVSCSPAPSYHCFSVPAACSAAGLSCGCAQSLCQTGYTCMSVTGAVIGCYQLVR